eukprot:Hpha_TRINITY_DN26165_c0_g1::TRINITY_DN26165_c0_g1_i1::g.155397::m.155397/K01011/TST, MPST, sseA; thiosulfate/3-mercaptopyruvate sulfurtransferase
MRRVVVDCSKSLEGFQRARIPGALHLGWPDQFEHRLQARAGREIPGVFLKRRDDPVRVVGRNTLRHHLYNTLGIGPEAEIVAYDDNNSLYATRLWWVLRHHRLNNCTVLDGGWRGYAAGGNKVETGPVEAPGEPRTLDEEEDEESDRLLASASDVAGLKPGTQLWDTRSPEEFKGEDKRGNSRGGHIPFARHLDWRECVGADGRFLAKDALEAKLNAVGLDPHLPTVTLCQMGIRAAFGAYVLEHVFGNERVKVYDASMVEWAADPTLPMKDPR